MAYQWISDLGIFDTIIRTKWTWLTFFILGRYKDDSTTPIYSLDSRKTTLRNAHHSPAHWLAGRAYLQAITSGTSSSTHHDVLLLHDSKNGGSSDENVSTTFSRGLRGDASTTSSLVTINNGATVNGMIQGPPSPSVLTLDPLEKEDEALYRCRVDFKRARTRNYEVQLVVIGRSLISLLKKYSDSDENRAIKL